MKTCRFFSLLLALLLISALLFGCSAQRSEAPVPAPAPAAEAPQAAAPRMDASAMDNSAGFGGGYNETQMETESAAAPSGQNVTGSAASEHKIIFNADLSLSTREFDQTLAYIENKITVLGGNIAQSSLNGKKPVEWNDSGRTAYITARIPSAKSEEFLRDVQGEAEVESLNRSSEDITSQFIDTKSRVEVLTIQLQRLKDILITRDKLADVLELEREIARITMEIEQLTTNLRSWDNLVKYATITIQLREVTQLTAPKPISTDLGTRIQEGFFSSITSVGRFLSDVVVFLISALPVLILLAIIGAVVWLILRRAAKRRAISHEKRNAMQAGYYKAYMDRFGMPPPPGSMAPEMEEPGQPDNPDLP